jgi:phage FluMu protein Com
MGLDIGVGGRGFIRDLDRENQIASRCKTCGRDKRVKGKVSLNTQVKQKCPECREPILWIKTGTSGEQEEWEWLAEHGKAVQRKKSKGVRIEFD